MLSDDRDLRPSLADASLRMNIAELRHSFLLSLRRRLGFRGSPIDGMCVSMGSTDGHRFQVILLGDATLKYFL